MEPLMIAEMITFILLLAISIVDIMTFNKPHGAIPSLLTTSLILINIVLLKDSLTLMQIVLPIIIGITLIDIGLFQGLADFKVYVGTSLIFSSFISYMLFSIEMVILAGLVIAAVRLYNRLCIEKNKLKGIPLIPTIWLAYIIIELWQKGVLKI